MCFISQFMCEIDIYNMYTKCCILYIIVLLGYKFTYIKFTLLKCTVP